MNLSPSSEASPTDHTRWFTDEVHPHDAQLKAYLRGSFPAVRDVDDIAQESYLRVWKARAVHPIQSAKAFLFQVARNLALNLVERERASPVQAIGDLVALPVLNDEPDAASTVGRNEKLRLLVDALVELPPRCREITVLRKLEGVPQREVARRLRISERTVEEQVSRGVKRCEAYLRSHGVQSCYDT